MCNGKPYQSPTIEKIAKKWLVSRNYYSAMKGKVETKLEWTKALVYPFVHVFAICFTLFAFPCPPWFEYNDQYAPSQDWINGGGGARRGSEMVFSCIINVIIRGRLCVVAYTNPLLPPPPMFSTYYSAINGGEPLDGEPLDTLFPMFSNLLICDQRGWALGWWALGYPFPHFFAICTPFSRSAPTPDLNTLFTRPPLIWILFFTRGSEMVFSCIINVITTFSTMKTIKKLLGIWFFKHF